MNKSKFYAAATLLTTSIVISGSLTGCVKNMNCNIQNGHAHVYETVDGAKAYRTSDKESLGDLYWRKDSVDINNEIYDMNKFNLLKITDNIDFLTEKMENPGPTLEYEYKYTQRVGKVTQIRKRFTDDNNHSRLTGRVRDVNYRYYGYKIGFDREGEKVIEKCTEPVLNILDIAEEYPYFKLDDFVCKIEGDPYESTKVDTNIKTKAK